VGYSVLPDSTDGLRPGERVWFAVRARNSEDQLSPWTKDLSTEVTWPWFVEGRIRLDDGSPAPPGIIVESLAPAFSDNTDGQGLFRLGPFRNIDGVEVRTTSSDAEPGGWYDYRTDFLTWEDEDVTIVLIGRHGVDPACRPELVNPTGDFLKYFRWMTLTRDNPDVEKATILNRWAEYPLSVHIPDFISGNGLDMGAATAQALVVWNAEMGETYFVAAADSASADVVFTFAEIPGADGTTTILLPENPPEPWPGRVVPEKLEVFIDWDSFPDEQTVTEVSMHELGHVLGIWSHATGGNCAAADYLMGLTGTGALDRALPIHPDEMNMARTIRRLPQGVDLSRYIQDP
jgi:hypothetical protein